MLSTNILHRKLISAAKHCFKVFERSICKGVYGKLSRGICYYSDGRIPSAYLANLDAAGNIQRYSLRSLFMLIDLLGYEVTDIIIKKKKSTNIKKIKVVAIDSETMRKTTYFNKLLRKLNIEIPFTGSYKLTSLERIGIYKCITDRIANPEDALAREFINYAYDKLYDQSKNKTK